jgi:RNA polymerase sigma-70 factor (ECF subfamily)
VGIVLVKAVKKSAGAVDGSEQKQVVRPLRFEGDDRALVRALLADHPGAYKALYQRHAKEVLTVLYRVLGPDDEMDELLHEVFVRAFRNVRSIDDPERLKSWLCGISVFVARGAIRRRRRGRWLQFFDPFALPENTDVDTNNDARRALKRAYELLGKLPTESRIAFSLRYIDGRELTEVAEMTGVSLATVKRRLRSAKSRFFAMARHEPELEEWIEDD